MRAGRRGGRRLPAAAAALAIALGVAPAGAAAQAASVAGGGFFETYSFSDASALGLRSLSLVTLPFGAAASLGPAVRLRVSGAWASGRLERADGSEATLSGPTDTEVRLSTTIGRDVLTLSAIGLVPTGVSELDGDQVDVGGMVASDLLPFRIGNWGSGGGIGASAAVAAPVGDFAVGVSAGYVVAREFEPLAQPNFRYRPGNQMHLRAAVDRSFGNAGKSSLSLAWQSFAADQANGTNLFHAGDRLQAVASHAFALGLASSGVAWAGWLHRSEGEFVAGPQPAPARNLYYAGAGARLPFGGGVLQPSAELRLQDLPDRDSGFSLGVGGSAELPLGGVTAIPVVQGRVGSVELGGGRRSGFVGAEVGLSLRFGAQPRSRAGGTVP